MKHLIPVMLAACVLLPLNDTRAEGLVAHHRLSLELARDLAQAALDACRSEGYQVAVVVVDRSGDDQVLLRDAMASRFNVHMARGKANAVVLSGVDSSVFRRNRQDIRMEVDHLPDLLMLEGGLPVRAGARLVGAIGVSGAPGGDKDEICARQAMEKLAERLEFADAD